LADCYACGRPLGLPWSVGGTIYHFCLVCWATHLARNRQAVALGKWGRTAERVAR